MCYWEEPVPIYDDQLLNLLVQLHIHHLPFIYSNTKQLAKKQVFHVGAAAFSLTPSSSFRPHSCKSDNLCFSFSENASCIAGEEVRCQRFPFFGVRWRFDALALLAGQRTVSGGSLFSAGFYIWRPSSSCACWTLLYTVWKAFVWAGIMTGVAPMRVRFPGLSFGGELVLELVVEVEVGVERRSGVLGTVWT